MQPETGEVAFSVSEFVEVLNQTLDYAYPSVLVTGELSNFRVSKNRWVYFDLKDDDATVRCFGTVYMLPGPLEDGMLLNVRAVPRLHPQFGFSLNVSSMMPAGEGSIRKAADLLAAKLAAEGLFDEERKRPLPYPPQRIGLVTSGESAAYADFTKILNARWQGVQVLHIDTQVQGEAAPAQLVEGIRLLNELAEPPEVIVLIRGGGSAEDLAAFSHEQVTRAVAGSRVPTLVAIGHEVDLSLAELAADTRASTPSNAAELLVPDRQHVLEVLVDRREGLADQVVHILRAQKRQQTEAKADLAHAMSALLRRAGQSLVSQKQLLEALSPQAVLQRGYAIVRANGKTVRSSQQLLKGASIEITFADGTRQAEIGEK
ncbi:MAG TPA: exodeoxyribonuclease VII large subunit [Candidatus Microsaccharimonas sp.]|nr:exodeoxyribonuclease VII large subunit [Candidatus Microsaccharimonas sp.]